MAIKKLQNDFTTHEQSKRLLELGVPVKSADCYYCIINATIQQGIEVICDSDIFFDINTYLKDFFPCWSAGRLMEIAHICSGSNLSYKEEAEELKKFKEEHKCETIIEAIIMCIEDAHSVGRMDFSKLEN